MFCWTARTCQRATQLFFYHARTYVHGMHVICFMFAHHSHLPSNTRALVHVNELNFRRACVVHGSYNSNDMMRTRATRFSDALSNLPSTIDKRLDMCATRLEGIKRESMEPNACTVSLRDQLFTICDEHDLCTFQTVKNMRVGTHPRNRGGGMLEPSSLPTRLQKLVFGGVSFAEMARACAVEKPSDPLTAKQYMAANKKLASTSPCMVNVESEYDLYSMTCSHTKECFKSAEGHVPCTIEEISEGGRISPAILTLRNPPLGQALTNGIEWRVFSDKFVRRFGYELIDLVIESDNQTYKPAKDDSTLDVMFKAVNVARQFRDESTKQVQWDKVRDIVLRQCTQGFTAEDIRRNVGFVRSSCIADLYTPWVIDECMDFAHSLTVKREPCLATLEQMSKLVDAFAGDCGVERQIVLV